MGKASSDASSVDRRTSLFLLGGAALYLAGCGGSSTGGNGGGGGVPNADVVIEIRGIAFNAPGGGDRVVIELGQTVGWVNRDNIPHTATSDQEPNGGNAFDFTFQGNGTNAVFQPNVRGTWQYHCDIHPNQMFGATIVVS